MRMAEILAKNQLNMLNDFSFSNRPKIRNGGGYFFEKFDDILRLV